MPAVTHRGYTPRLHIAVTHQQPANAHFMRLFEKYEALDKDIVRAEQRVENLDDLELDALKMQRVQLKDELVDMLQKY